MMKKLPKQPQLEMFKTTLVSFVHPGHELFLLANKIDWDGLEKEFEPLHGTLCRPSVPIRTIVGLLLLKQMYNLGDETVVDRCLENPYCSTFAVRSIFNATFRLIRVTLFTPGIGSVKMEWRRYSSRA